VTSLRVTAMRLRSLVSMLPPPLVRLPWHAETYHSLGGDAVGQIGTGLEIGVLRGDCVRREHVPTDDRANVSDANVDTGRSQFEDAPFADVGRGLGVAERTVYRAAASTADDYGVEV